MSWLKQCWKELKSYRKDMGVVGGFFLVIGIAFVGVGIRLGWQMCTLTAIYNCLVGQGCNLEKDTIEAFMIPIGFGMLLINIGFIIIRIRKTDTQISKSEEQISESKKQLKQAEQQIKKSDEQIFTTIFQKGMDMLFSENRLQAQAGVDYLGDLVEDNKNNLRAVGQIFRVFRSYLCVPVKSGENERKAQERALVKEKIVQCISTHHRKFSAIEGGIDLQRADLQGVHLQDVNLQKVNLEGANLAEALKDVNLRGACLLYVEYFGLATCLLKYRSYFDYALFSSQVYDTDGGQVESETAADTFIYYEKDSNTFRFGEDSDLPKEQLIDKLQQCATELKVGLVDVVNYQIRFISENL